MSYKDLPTLVDFATEIAQGAGEITLRYFRGDFVRDRKPDAIPVFESRIARREGRQKR